MKVINVVKIAVIALIAVVMTFVASCDGKDAVTEKAPDLSLTHSYSSIIFSADGTTTQSDGKAIDPTFTVNTQEAKWNAVSNQTWLSVTKQSTSFTLTAEAVDGTTRAHAPATVTVTGFAAKPVFISVTQSAFVEPNYRNITGQVLKNAREPFEYETMVLNNRWYMAPDWTANAAAAQNGVVDINPGGTNSNICLTIWTWGGLSPASSITNGKLYQTVELEAGSYRLQAVCFNNIGASWEAYLVAALGNELPDIGNVSGENSFAIPIERVTTDVQRPSDDQTVSLYFYISEKSTVSLGFVASINGNSQLIIRSVELWEAYY